MAMLLSWLKTAWMPFYLIDLQVDFWYTVCMYKMIIMKVEVFLYG